MWQEKTALVTLESFFQKDERFQIVQRLPWFYAFSKQFILALLLFFLLAAGAIIIFYPPPAILLLLAFMSLCAFLYYAVTRSVYGNYTVITQFSVYRYIRKQIQQIDELPFSKVESITVKQLDFFPKYASVTIRCYPAYVKEMPFLKRLYALKTVQKNPEKADMRSLSLGKPVYLRLVCKNPREVYLVLRDIKYLMGYTFRLYAKGGKHGKR